MKRNMKNFTFSCLGFLIALCMQAQIIHVPGDYLTIQQGINAANPGDTVIVDEGTYYEQINFVGKKPLTVASLFLTDGDTSHISRTIIDGSQITNPDSATVVYLYSGEDTTSVLCGFTIQGGKGTATDLWGGKILSGGGIFIANSGATIRNNNIQDNELNDTLSTIITGVLGGGMYVIDGFPGWTIIKNNRVINNRAISGFYVAEGGGICVITTNTRILENKISVNLCQCTTMDGFSAGGGLICMAGDIAPFAAISSNEISGNKSLAPGISFGGGASTWSLDNSSYTMNNVFSGNKSDWYGGGLDFFSFNLTNFRVESNYFIDNEAFYGGGVDAFDTTSRLILTNNVFIHNTAYDQGGAVYVNRPNGSPEEHLLISVNNSFYDNHASGAGGAVFAYEDNPLVFNSLLWQNPGLANNAITVDSGTSEIAFSDLDTNQITGDKIIGAGMINADPMFSDTNLLMTEHWSPCVDKGAGTYNCTHGMTFDAPAFDMLGTPRPVGGKYDMGAYDMQGWGLGWSPLIGSDFSLLIYPNPFPATINIRYTVPGSCQVTVCIYNNLGQLVGMPVSEWQQEGSHIVTWDAVGLDPGLFLVKVRAGNAAYEGRLVKF